MAGKQSGADEKGYLTIGRLVETMKDKYPDLSISKVRYLEEEGLLTPERTAGGYRKFSPREIQRLEIIMRLQQEHFLPLAVIKRKLADLDAGNVPAELSEIGASVRTMTLPLEDATVVAAEEVAAAVGVSPEVVREIEAFGLVKAKETSDGKAFDALDVEILRACQRLSRLGIEPRHLRMYGTFAQRESAFFQQIVLPASRQRQREGKDAEKVSEVIDELSQGTQYLHNLLLRRAIRDDLGEAAETDSER